MSRLNVWVPDELAQEARSAGLNVSALTRAAISSELAGRATDAWLDSLPEPRGRGPSDEAVLSALDEARDEFGAARG
jgi:post-segregation antitoxin (ccd killing protein)